MKILTKLHMNFDFYKLSKYIDSKDFESNQAEAEGEDAVNAYKKFITKGNVKPNLAEATRKARRARKKNPSIGGDRPLYDTGKLVNSLTYDKKQQAVKGIHYAKTHLEPFVLNGKPVPARNFIEQADKVLGQEISQNYFANRSVKKLIVKIRKHLKGTYFKKTFVR